LEKEISHGLAEADTLHIEPDVVATIAALAASEVPGVAGMSDVSLVGMLRKNNLAKGVKATVGEREAAIDVYVILDYGVKIPEVALRVQENVRTAIETMTSLVAVEVNVHVQSVAYHETKPETKGEPLVY